MGESSLPTAADYAADYASANASDALRKIQSLESRVAHLEHHLRKALVAIDELRTVVGLNQAIPDSEL